MKTKENKGVTLIALAVTIIIMLIITTIITKQIVTKKTIKLKITQNKIQIIMVVQMIGFLIQIRENKMFKEEFSL